MMEFFSLVGSERTLISHPELLGQYQLEDRRSTHECGIRFHKKGNR